MTAALHFLSRAALFKRSPSQRSGRGRGGGAVVVGSSDGGGALVAQISRSYFCKGGIEGNRIALGILYMRALIQSKKKN